METRPSNASPKTTLLDRYQERLKTIPSPGYGAGCHGDILGVANRGVKAGLSAQRICDDIRANIPHGRRTVSDREIMDAINKAFGDHDAGVQPLIKPKPVVNNGNAIRLKLVDRGKGTTEADFSESSPIRLDWSPEEDPIGMLQTLYNPDDLIYIGERLTPGLLGKNIRPCKEWVDHFSKGGKAGPYIVPNPLNGQPVPTKSGAGVTFRGDRNVSVFRFCVVEFDNISIDDQSAFWASVDLPICVLIDSGGKSIHGWIDVRRLADVSTLEAWDRHIKNRLYVQALIPLGVDSACSNPSRLSRLPGHFRADTGRQQRLLYLSPEGRRVH
jgi:hypothetical protein